jgi:hypothetical protein
MQEFITPDSDHEPTDSCSYEEGVFARKYFYLEQSILQDLSFDYRRGAMAGDGILQREFDALKREIDKHSASLTVDTLRNGPDVEESLIVKRDWVLTKDTSNGIAKSLVYHHADDSTDASSIRYVTSCNDNDGFVYSCSLTRSSGIT